MSVLFWIIMICLLLVFVVALFSSVGSNQQTGDDRKINLLIAVVSLVLMIAMNNLWR